MPVPVADDADLFAELRRHVVKAVGRVCPSWLRADHDDIVQVAMMRLHHVLSQGEETAALSSSYIWRTAFSVTIDEIRRRARRGETALADGEAAPVILDAAPNPEEHAMARELGLAIRECLSLLSDDRRAAVVLHLQGHPVPEIARLLGWNAKKAENLVYRGLTDLRTRLTAKGLRA